MIALCREAGPTKTIDPCDVARRLAEGEKTDAAWQSHLQSVRDTAIGLARAGKIVIYRKGVPVDPDDFRGVYRLGTPNIS
jgi:hypothetical protein